MPRDERGRFISEEEFERKEAEKQTEDFEPQDDTDLIDYDDFQDFGEEEY
jgi:hypothetical protein